MEKNSALKTMGNCLIAGLVGVLVAQTLVKITIIYSIESAAPIVLADNKVADIQLLARQFKSALSLNPFIRFESVAICNEEQDLLIAADSTKTELHFCTLPAKWVPFRHDRQLPSYDPPVFIKVQSSVPQLLAWSLSFFAGFAIFAGLILIAFDRAKKRNQELIRALTFAEVAAQVAHDIRSPLSALKIGLTKLQDVQAKELCHHAIQRIQDTLSSILVKNRSSSESQIEERPIEPFDLVAETQKVLQTKQLETSVSVDFSTELQAAQVYGHASSWGNILSNLINNSIDAQTSASPKIAVNISRIATFYQVTVVDQGKGMSKELVRRMMTNPTSHGKEGSRNSGYGLGLRGAQSELLKWNCSLNIQSEEGVGTKITILFPAADA